MPNFFVPMVDEEKQEEVYHQLARFAGAGAYPAPERIYSMTWKHDGVVWTATVGMELHGPRQKDWKGPSRDLPQVTSEDE